LAAVATIALTGALAVAGPMAAPASASCVGPYIDAQPPGGTFGADPPTVAPGGTITVYGHWYTSTCNDTGGNDPLEPLEPSGRSMGFAAAIRLPEDAPNGPATVDDGVDYGPDYTFAIDPSGVSDATIVAPAEEEDPAAPSEDGGPPWLLGALIAASAAAATVVLGLLRRRT
jgi:hypothetical protein